MDIVQQLEKLSINNRGTGAGGANTNVSGKTFESVTDIYPILIENGFEKIKINNSKYGYCLYKKVDDKKFYFVSQSGLRSFIKKFHDKQLFRFPDEAFIVSHADGKHTLYVLEKKNQTVEGSVDTKLYAGQGFKLEYEDVLGDSFTVEYAFCLSDFFRQSKYKRMFKVLSKQSIRVFFASDVNYFDNVREWIGLLVANQDFVRL